MIGFLLYLIIRCEILSFAEALFMEVTVIMCYHAPKHHGLGTVVYSDFHKIQNIKISWYVDSSCSSFISGNDMVSFQLLAEVDNVGTGKLKKIFTKPPNNKY